MRRLAVLAGIGVLALSTSVMAQARRTPPDSCCDGSPSAGFAVFTQRSASSRRMRSGLTVLMAASSGVRCSACGSSRAP